MVWVRIDDRFHENTKAVEVGPLGRDLFIASLEYANRHLTDGLIPRGIVGQLVNFYYIPGTEISINPYDIASLLVDVGMWHEVSDGYQIHDYEDYQPTRDEVERQRKLKADRQRRWRENLKTSVDASTDSTTDSTTDASRDGASRIPVPIPESQDPEPKPERGDANAAILPPTNQPYELYVAFIDIKQPAEITDKYKSRNLGIARNLLAAGYLASDILACTRYLQSEHWRTNPWDLKAVAGAIDGWIADGRPIQERVRGSPVEQHSGIREFSQIMDEIEGKHASDHIRETDGDVGVYLAIPGPDD